jgi:hypothetical protein
LAPLAKVQDWRPEVDRWSFRFLAAHLAATERECFQERIHRIAADRQPSFAYYSDTGRDFGDRDLRVSLESWQDTRKALFAFVRQLPSSAWDMKGQHERYGDIGIWDVLRSMQEHDREHLEELDGMMARYRSLE